MAMTMHTDSAPSTTDSYRARTMTTGHAIAYMSDDYRLCECGAVFLTVLGQPTAADHYEEHLATVVPDPRGETHRPRGRGDAWWCECGAIFDPVPGVATARQRWAEHVAYRRTLGPRDDRYPDS